MAACASIQRMRNLLRFYSIDSSVLEYSTRNADISKNLRKWYPSLSNLPKPTMNIPEFLSYYKGLEADNTSVRHTIYGRIKGIRFSGKKIGFVDLWYRGSGVQLIVNFKNLDMSFEMFQKHMRQFKIGDHVQVTGYPGVSQKHSTLSIKAVSPIQILSPAQVPVPPKLTDAVKRRSHKVLDYLVNGTQNIHLRHVIIKRIREWLYSREFVEVETPIISAKSNGANAKPFITHCNAFDKDRQLELRVAPELWLKRLCVGGMDRIFEIGKVFRNEGIDSTHNPEFTTLEFYQTYTDMEQLIAMSEQLLMYVCEGVNSNISNELIETINKNGGHFKRIEFLPVLTEKTGIDFQSMDLSDVNMMKSALASKNILLPSSLQSPNQILDELCSRYIECDCDSLLPTIIYHHPTIISPLAKSDTKNNQISKRFEIFIRGKEYINAYEEENCPDFQLQKFKEQAQCKALYKDDEMMGIDMPYVQAMRYGMSPIGGFGLGVDRLCMLLADEQRIEEVLAFGCLDDVNRQ